MSLNGDADDSFVSLNWVGNCERVSLIGHANDSRVSLIGDADNSFVSLNWVGNCERTLIGAFLSKQREPLLTPLQYSYPNNLDINCKKFQSFKV